jgi:hypothetical protein
MVNEIQKELWFDKQGRACAAHPREDGRYTVLCGSTLGGSIKLVVSADFLRKHFHQ